MDSIDQLYKLMTFNASMNTTEIESSFKQIAKMLFESFAIQKGENIYLFKEIEFYFYNKNHRDIITHPRVSNPLCWYINNFGGIDLNFASNIKQECKLDSKRKNVKNILVLQNWLERIRKEVTNKVLSIKRISDFLNFPILAQPTLKKI